MNVADIRQEFDHPSWFTAAGTIAAYGLIIVAMAVVLFGVPLIVFSLL